MLLGSANKEKLCYSPVLASAFPPLLVHSWLICSLTVVVAEAEIVTCCVRVWYWCTIREKQSVQRSSDIDSIWQPWGSELFVIS